jgi:hypothetical protein
MVIEQHPPDHEGNYKAAGTLCANLEAPGGASEADPTLGSLGICTSF